MQIASGLGQVSGKSLPTNVMDYGPRINIGTRRARQPNRARATLAIDDASADADNAPPSTPGQFLTTPTPAPWAPIVTALLIVLVRVVRLAASLPQWIELL